MEDLINNADQVTDASGVNDVSGTPPLNTLETAGGFPQPGAYQPNVDGFNQNADGQVEGVSGQIPANGTPIDLKAVNERLMQQNARTNKMLAAMGVDPMSDIAEQLESGLITEDMVRNHFRGNQQPAQPSQQYQAYVAQDPIALAQQELDDAQTSYDTEAASGEGISIETNNRLLKAMSGNFDAKLNGVTQKFIANEQVTQANANVDAVLSVARSDPHFAQMEAGLQQATERVSLSLTGTLADQGARELGLDPTTLSPQQYHHFAGKANALLESLKQHYIQVGAQQVRAGQVPNTNMNTNRFVPNPAGSGGGSVAPPQSPYQRATLANHKDLARQYMNNAGRV